MRGIDESNAPLSLVKAINHTSYMQGQARGVFEGAAQVYHKTPDPKNEKWYRFWGFAYRVWRSIRDNLVEIAVEYRTNPEAARHRLEMLVYAAEHVGGFYQEREQDKKRFARLRAAELRQVLENWR